MWPTASLLDAGFNSGELYDKLERAGYVMRLRDNTALSRLADPHLARGQPGQRQYHELSEVARAASCSWWSPHRANCLPGIAFCLRNYLVVATGFYRALNTSRHDDSIIQGVVYQSGGVEPVPPVG